jgi:valyl-tRNA synthetase
MVDPVEQRERLEKEATAAQSQVDRLEKLLASPFTEKAPPEVVDKERQKLADYQESLKKINAQLEALDREH